jgi:hypothetical protein
MRMLTCLLFGALVLGGCARSRSTRILTPVPVVAGMAGTNSSAAKPKLIVTAETVLIGKVVRVKEDARFAVLNFPVGMMPGVQQRLNVYRHGLKVGEVKVVGPRDDDNTVADIINGEVQVGDELRAD